MGEIVNRVKNSSLITIDVSDFYDGRERINLEISDFLDNGILIESISGKSLKIMIGLNSIINMFMCHLDSYQKLHEQTLDYLEKKSILEMI